MYPGHWASESPDRAAIVMGGTGETVTYAELDDRSRRLAAVLRDAGLQRGDHVALLSENRPEFFDVAWAALRSGLYLTPVNRHLTADEVAYILEDSEAKAVVTSAGLSAITEAIDWSGLPAVSCRLTIGAGPGVAGDYGSALAAASPLGDEEQSSGSFMLYTSGTTGRPKGVVRALPDTDPTAPDPGALGFSALFGLSEETVYLSPAPLYHAAPLGWTTSVHRLGGTVVVMERFDAQQALELIEAHAVTASQWVPTMFVRMLDLPEEVRGKWDLSSHQVAVHAAAPCPVDVKRAMIAWWGPILVEYYAGTDSGGMTVIDSADWLDHPGSVGRSVGGSIHIIGEDGAELPPGEPGTVYLAGGPAFEYKGDPDKTAGARLPGGLSTMGDGGYLDADGYLYLTDRTDFMIISGGVNIYPREIEDVLIMHPAVLDVAVFGVPNAEFGEEVKAAVQLRSGVAATPGLSEELVEHCRAKLAGYKLPRSIDYVDELPRTPTGKLLKRVLREPYVAQPGG